MSAIISGSSVHRGGYWCEVDDCLPDGVTPATHSAWRVRPGRSATWLCCDRHRDQLAGAVGHDERLGIERWLYLPLILPTQPLDPYTTIALQELCSSIAGLARTGPRVPDHPLCGFDIYGFGTRKTKRPCRARATQMVENWIEVANGDLYLCDRHAKTLKRRERDSGGEFETELVLDFGGGQ